MSAGMSPAEQDASGHGLIGTCAGGRSFAVLPNGDRVADFDGATGYLEIADSDALSPATTGAFTLETWTRPDTLQFPHSESSGYVHWAGKGAQGEHEYVERMYPKTDTENRPNRISGHAFNRTWCRARREIGRSMVRISDRPTEIEDRAVPPVTWGRRPDHQR